MIPYEGKKAADIGVNISKYDESIRYYEIRNIPEFRLYGLLDSTDKKSYVRIPESVSAQTNESLIRVSRMLSGGRIRFVTDSDYIALKCCGSISCIDPVMPNIGASCFDAYLKRTGKYVHVGNFVFHVPHHDGWFHGILDAQLPKGRKEITINFPLFNTCTDIYIGLDKDSTLEAHPDYTYEKPVLFYGSSITQGYGVSRPGLSYPAIISRRYDTNFINLGLSDNAKAEDPIIDYLTSLDPSVFVLDYDYNAPTVEHLAATHEKLYLTFRKAHPNTPVVIVTMPVTGPENPNTLARRNIIYSTYLNAFKRGEKVIFIDGAYLFGSDVHGDCTVDGCHPNVIGAMRMADVIGKAVDYAISISGGNE